MQSDRIIKIAGIACLLGCLSVGVVIAGIILGFILSILVPVLIAFTVLWVIAALLKDDSKDKDEVSGTSDDKTTPTDT